MIHGYRFAQPLAYKTHRFLVKTQIVIHQLIFITAIVLVPLLVWHIATLDFFEDYRMHAKKDLSSVTQVLGNIKRQMKHEQLSEVNIALWVAVWMLTPSDIVYALWYLGRCQSQLHPTVGEDIRSVETTDELDHRPSSTNEQQSERMDDLSATDRQTAIRRRSMYLNLDNLKASSRHPHIWTYTRRFRRYTIPLLPLSLDISMIFILTLHVFTFLRLIGPSLVICWSDAVAVFSTPDLVNITFEDSSNNPIFDLRRRCERYHFNFTVAGGFSSAVAALLAVMHLVSLLCRIVGMVYILKARPKRKADQDTIQQDQAEKAEWHVQPRDIDIHERGQAPSSVQAPSEKPGRLTVISEEEQSIEGTLTRRRRPGTSRSGGSGISRTDFAVQGRREEGFLECLVP